MKDREALIQEVPQEVGLRVSPVAKVWESQSEDGTSGLHWWTAEAEQGDVVMHPGEVSDTRWVTSQEFSQLQPVFEGDRVFFDHVRCRQRGGSRPCHRARRS
ncbi:hypothetical protein LXH13_00300 [Streptomyces spinosirectus]|uniref:NUDIX domain-containing protein n=1 Tax=Streptomyces TaxID=1883 RepID=UPI001C9D7D33|nr:MULTISPECIES: NUDIX domain-containing protein [Streptomyces]MBY8344041.1 hypothetical protein [Streptomyces plumbidurans]UIR15559.1 hypothetical protein LXH13_00300 [Streptomyces spinosirectus]